MFKCYVHVRHSTIQLNKRSTDNNIVIFIFISIAERFGKQRNKKRVDERKVSIYAI